MADRQPKTEVKLQFANTQELLAATPDIQRVMWELFFPKTKALIESVRPKPTEEEK